MLPFAILSFRSSSLIALVVLLTACGSVLETDKVNYKSESDAKNAAPLEVPPDLTKMSRNKKYELPGGSVSAKTLSGEPTTPSLMRPARCELPIYKSREAADKSGLKLEDLPK